LLRHLFLIVILAVSLRAQIVVRPDIDVLPTFGAPAGGERIRITFLGSATNTCATGVICTPIVTFDGLPATVAENNTGSIVVVTPPHARGDVKISIDVDGTKYQAAFHYLTEEDYERVLMPIVVGGPGAFGTNWSAESWIANSGVDPVDVRLSACQLLISPCPPFIHLPPGGHQFPLTPDRASAIPTPGAFIYVPRWALSQIHLNSRVVETSRQGDQWGTELPFIRTADFVRDVLLLNVPNDSRFRTRLRIYGSSSAPQAARIRVWPATSDLALVDQIVNLAGFVTILPVPFPNEPAYAEIALDSYTNLPGNGPLRVEITSEGPLWAFASITNNSTQLVTTITPQPGDRR
jgi:hypothetical protein